MPLLGQKNPKKSSLFWYIRPYMQFKLINITTNDQYNKKAQQKHYHANNNAIQIILGLDYLIGPKKHHQYYKKVWR